MSRSKTAMLIACLCAGLTLGTVSASASTASYFFLRLPPLATAMGLGSATLAPLSAVRFCIEQRRQCESSSDEVLGLDRELFATLSEVNLRVNDQIQPMAKSYEGAGTWAINPGAGDCNDYAVSKRHELMQRGMPASALLLAVVRTRAGEGHLVLVVRTDRGDYVLDNLTSQIRPWDTTGYRWLKRQSADNPRHWTTVGPAREPPSRERPAATLVAAAAIGDASVMTVALVY